MAFTTCEDLLRAMGNDIVNMTQYSMEQTLLDLGVSQQFIDELAMAVMRNNYGQTPDVHGFVGAVGLIGAEPGLWSVIGGNKNIPETLLKESKASLLKGRVTSIALVKGDQVTYEIDYVNVDDEKEGQSGTREYDLVILASPIQGTKYKIAFVDFPSPVADFTQNYHRTVALFTQGKINKTTFHTEDESQFPPDLFTIDKDLFFNSIGKQSPVNPSDTTPKESVWKTFLNTVPSDLEISELFENISDLKMIDWLAYPKYKANMDLPPFVLHEHLYYINAIESAASAMEMSAIGAKNVALLAFNHWYGHLDRIDETNLSPATTDESRTDL